MAKTEEYFEISRVADMALQELSGPRNTKNIGNAMGAEVKKLRLFRLRVQLDERNPFRTR
jgi:hypothetical protein